MTGTPIPVPRLTVTPAPGRIRYTAAAIDAPEGTYQAVFSFPMPRSARTCVDGSHGRAIPDMIVTDPAGMTIHWVLGGRTSLPDTVNSVMAALAADVIAREHACALRRDVPPVPESAVTRFRRTDPNASIETIRLAGRIAARMVEDLGMGSDRTALWVAANFVSTEYHLEETAGLTERIDELESEAAREAEAAEAARADGDVDRAAKVLDNLESLRIHGRGVLEFRAGRDDIEKVLDLLGAAA